VAENFGIETLAEPEVNASSAENNSSAILLFKDNNETFLFTSDAGVPALAGAVEVANRIGVDLSTAKGLQVPHHGSKHNVGPAILNLIVGPKKAAEQTTKTAIVSAPKKGEPRHPSKKVINAFIRRGAKVCPTQGKTVCFRGSDTPPRAGWVEAVALPFSNQVEE
jgi:beta-lactamase superfamily II metal-dependent hydrolase